MINLILAASLKRQRRATNIAIVLAIIAAMSGVALLAISGWFLTGAALAGAGGMAAVKAFNYLLPSAAIRGLAIARTMSRYGERLYSHRAAFFALAEVRPALFTKLAGAAPADVLTRPAGEIAAQLGGDVDALEDSAIRKVTAPAAFAAAMAALASAILSGWVAAVALCLGFAVMHAAARVMTRHMLPQWVQQRADAMAAFKSAYADYAPCAADIVAYNLMQSVEAALLPLAERLDEARMGEVRAEALILGVQTVIASVTVAAVLALSANGVAFAALSALAAAGAAEIWAGLARNSMQAERVRWSLVRLSSLASLPPRQPATDRPLAKIISIDAGEGTITLSQGQSVLIAGRTGSGKSRLLGTLIGLREDAPQSLAIEGQDVRGLGLDYLRKQFAYAPQDAAQLAGTVSDNLRLARPGVSEEDMWEALHSACLDDVVRALPHGLMQWLGNDGARLSGGQRKRLALARALLSNKPWLVLDEPSEGLDAKTETLLAKRLRANLDATGRGLILVSHRKALHHLAKIVVHLK